MSVYEVKDKLVAAINANKYDFIVANFANSDMVGYTRIRRMVNNQLPSVSVRGRLSVSAMSVRNDSFNLKATQKYRKH